LGASATVLTSDGTDAAWAAAALAPTTTKGDISGYTTTQARIPISTNNFSLYGDSTAALGLKWAASPTSTLTTTGDLLAASAANVLTRIAGGDSGEILTGNGAGVLPTFQAAAGASVLTKVTKSYSDITGNPPTIPIYTLAADQALTNVYTDVTTVFDLSTAVTIGDGSDDNGFQQATNWTSGTGLTDASRGAYVTSFKTMRSTSGTTAISAYNFTTGGDSMGSSADGTIYGADFDETTPNPFSTGWVDFVRANTDYCAANGAVTAMSTIGTISVWFKVNQLDAEDNDDRVWQFGDTDGNNTFYVGLNTSTDALEITNSTNRSASSNIAWRSSTDASSIVADTWYHLVITHNGTTPTIWLGALGSTIDDQTNLDITYDETIWIFPTYIDNFNIGRQNYNSTIGNYLDGGIAELAMWNVVLTEAEINILHDNNDSTPQAASTHPTGLRVYFSFNPENNMDNDAPVTYDTQGAVDFYLQIAS